MNADVWNADLSSSQAEVYLEGGSKSETLNHHSFSINMYDLYIDVFLNT